MMQISQPKRFELRATQIECLVCGTARVVFGLAAHETGECGRCHYRGWTYSDELDGTTHRLLLGGAFGGAVVERRRDPRPGPHAA
jgi:ribosomal protein S27AE